MHLARLMMGSVLALGIGGLADIARADELAAFYRATWAGLPAAEIRLGLGDTPSDYRHEIRIETQGVPHWFTRFRADAVGEGRLVKNGGAIPARYNAHYDLRKRRNQLLSLRFVERDGELVAERAPGDTSHKPILAEIHRRDVLDPIAALASIRQQLRVKPPQAGDTFTIPVFDDARRFDIAVRVIAVGGEEDTIHLGLTLRPIAGFKGESSDDSDPDSAPRPVDLTLSNDARLLPLTLRVRIAFLPVWVQLDHVCASFAACGAQR